MNINKISISIEGVYHLCFFLRNKKSLKKIYIQDNQIKLDQNDEYELFSKTLEYLSGLSNLEEIDFSSIFIIILLIIIGNCIKDGCKYLENTIKNFNNLKSLNISSIFIIILFY